MQGLLFVVTAASGTGKTTLVRALREQLAADGQPLALSVSHTTRDMRPGEVQGEHYHFVSREQFQQLTAAGGFLEQAEVFGNYYGTSEAAVLHCLEQGQDVLLEIDWQGAQQVRQRFRSCIQLFILPPDLQTLRQRLVTRAQDTEEVISLRLSQSRAELAQYVAADYLIINDNFGLALQDMLAVIRASRLTLGQQTARHQAMIASLLADPV